MRHAGPTRREIGVRTAFNLLGPLTNPAGTTRQLLGVGDAGGRARMAEVAQRLGTERTFVIHGAGIDELPLDGTGVLYHVGPDGRRAARDPGVAAGLRRRDRRRSSRAGRADDNARMVEAVLRGEPGARRDVVAPQRRGRAPRRRRVGSMEEGIERAALTIDAGLGLELLERLRAERRAAEAAGVTA